MDSFFLLNYGEQITTEHKMGHYFIHFPQENKLQIVSVGCEQPDEWYHSLFENYEFVMSEFLPLAENAPPSTLQYKSALLHRVMDNDGKAI